MSLQKEVEIVILGNKFNVPFPNTGQFLEIRSKISALTGNLNIHGSYDQYATVLAEMIAHYNVLIPELKSKLNVESIGKLSLIESRTLLESYTTVYEPFFNSWMQILTAPKSTPEVEDIKI